MTEVSEGPFLLGSSWHGMICSRITESDRAEPGAGLLIPPGALPVSPSGRWKSEPAGHTLGWRVKLMRKLLSDTPRHGRGPSAAPAGALRDQVHSALPRGGRGV